MCLLHMFDALWQGVVVHELKLGFLQQVPLVYVLTVCAIIGPVISNNNFVNWACTVHAL
jgi:hypothetical protein